MLVLHSRGGESRIVPAEVEAIELTPDVIWIDLLSPTQGEIAAVEEASGLSLPSQAELSEIETSSRLRTDGDVVCLSAPLVFRSQAEDPGATPVGFVLAPELLVTVRYEALNAFDTYDRAARGSASEVFVGLIEAIVDRIADVLERIAAELDLLSHRLFRSRSVGGGDRRTRAQENAEHALDPAPTRRQRRSYFEDPRQLVGAGAHRSICRDDARRGTPRGSQNPPGNAAP